MPPVHRGIKTAEHVTLQTWYLQKELLVRASPFFAAALDGSFAEATSKKISLPEESPDVFALFVRWLYLGEIHGTFCWMGDGNSGDGKLAVIKVILQTCSLGDKLGCLHFLDLAILELINLHQVEVIGSETICYIFEHFAPNSKLRQYAIDQFRHDLQEGQFGGEVAHYISNVMSAEGFGRDFLQTSMEAKGRDAVKPQTNTGRYLEVLIVPEE